MSAFSPEFSIKMDIPIGFCQCGCGQKTTLRTSTCKRLGRVKGQPALYANGHTSNVRRQMDVSPEPFVLDGEMCRYMPLTYGQVAIVDASDYEWLNQWKWSAVWNKGTDSYYACRTDSLLGKLRMHRFIMGATKGDGNIVDHRTPTRTLDNRRSNLRVSTHEGNNQNRRGWKSSKSGLKGVHATPYGWKSSISANGKEVFLGNFKDKSKAHVAYCEAADKLHGEFSNHG